jgi:hypothetical protein
MSAVLRISAIVHDLDLPRNTFENDDAPIFTVINGGTSSLRPYGLTGPGCVEAIERVPREISLRQTSDFLDPTAPARDGTDESVSNGQRSRSNETVYLHRSLGKGAMLAGPFPTTPCIERKPTLEPCQRRVPARDVVPFEHRVNVDNQDHEGDQTRKSGTLELSYTDSLLVTAEAPSIRKGSASNDPKVDPRCDQIRARKRRQFSNRTRTGCGTCRTRKKKCDEAKPKCKNCLQGKFECAGYRKPIQRSDDNSVQVRSARKLHQPISLTEGPAHIVRCVVCNIIHNPLCEQSQKIYAEHTIPSRITTSQTKPVRADRPDLQVS